MPERLGEVSLNPCRAFREIILKKAGDIRGALPVTAVHDDMLNFAAHCETPVELCVCMGDTLPHLATFEQVRRKTRT